MRSKRLAKERKQRDEERKTRKIVFGANGRAKGQQYATVSGVVAEGATANG